jgi:hypothetical protein
LDPSLLSTFENRQPKETMSTKSKFLASLFAAFLLLAVFPSSELQAQQKLQAKQIGSRIDITVAGRFFTSYRFYEDEKYPFFYPVNGPSGASVTSMRNGRFPHHSSLFFGCDHVNGGNYWQDVLSRGRIVSSGPRIEVGSGHEIIITDGCDWTREGASQPIRDTRRIVVSAPTRDLRQIDFSITLEALEDVTIRKTNHSLFSARMDPDLTPVMGGVLLNANGQEGEKATFGKPSPWLACFGPREQGNTEGLAILQHPSNPGFPAPWFTRDYGFLSPTPMYWPEDGKATRIAKGESLTLSYRVLVFAGTPESIGIAEVYESFAAKALEGAL